MPAPPDRPGPLDPQHHHRGVRAVQRMVEHAPSSGSLALWVGHRDLAAPAEAGPALPAARRADAPTPDPPLATDGHTLLYAPGFEALPLAEQTGWVAHAVLHIALRHVQRREALRVRLGQVDDALFNHCADAIVNTALAHLRWLSLPAGAVELPALLDQVLERRETAQAALLHWDVERLYLAVDDREREGDEVRDGPRAARLRRLAAGQGADLRQAAGAEQALRPEEEAEAARAWHERLLRGHADDGAHSMLRTLLADLPRVRTPWEQVLRRVLARALSRRPGLSWSRPTRSYLANQGRAGAHGRLPWEPGTTPSRSVPRLAVVVDVSGSIDARLLERFGREIVALTRRLQAPWSLVVGDDAVREQRHFEPGRADFTRLAAAGDGGTDFTPLLQAAEALRPDLIVVLTDLDGPARYRPACPVLWAVPEVSAGAPAPAPPFGRLLVLD